MRLAFVDHVFSWPPLGGAPADVYYTIRGLQALGHEVRLFYGAEPDNWFLSEVAEQELPFECTRVEFLRGEVTPENVAARYRAAVDAFAPDVVFNCFAFLIKPFIAQALSHYPQICRYYAYEPFCPRDYRLWLDFKTCPNNFLSTPNVCNKCTWKRLWRSLRTGRPDGYAWEYQATEAYTKRYHELLLKSIEDYSAIIVYNHFTKDLLGGRNANVHVIGGGVNLDEFSYSPLEPKAAGEKTIILMTGRAEDLSKGAKNLWKAGEMLARTRDDFQIWITDTDQRLDTPWFKAIGWHPFSKIKEFYRQADICCVPSVWEEPFGLVAVEAMATGRACVVSDVGGLQEIVVEGETGHIFDRDDPAALAAALGKALASHETRRAMGDAGRRRVEELYTWDKVIARHYPAMLEAAVR
jgi:glycosyltransferase involved in cell wall biosynthesis